MREHIFISHASEDKESVARPIALRLREKGIDVWFDEFELNIGDSLRRKIDQALSSCAFGIVILSPDFFLKEWPQRELDALSTLEIARAGKVILPVWHNITYNDVVGYSPPLADKFAVSTQEGIGIVADKLEIAIRGHVLKTRRLTRPVPKEPYTAAFGFVFDREGKFLIRRRSPLAKFNKGMWDKPLGAYVSYEHNEDSLRAVMREFVEELFLTPIDLDGLNPELVNWDKLIVNLGEWSNNRNHALLAEEIKDLSESWLCFSLINSEEIPHIAVLPSGKRQIKGRIVDLYLLLANKCFSEQLSYLNSIQNDWRLIKLTDLSSIAQDGGVKTDSLVDTTGNQMMITPDMQSITTSSKRCGNGHTDSIRRNPAVGGKINTFPTVTGVSLPG